MRSASRIGREAPVRSDTPSCYSSRATRYFLLASETAAVALPLAQETPWTWEDYTPIAQVAADYNVMVVRDDSPFESLEDVIEEAEQGEVTVGVSGAVGVDAITAQLVSQEAGVEFEQVVFQGGGATMTALLGGDIDFAIGNFGELIGQLEAGEIRGLAVFKEERASGELASEIPTGPEQGVDVTVEQFRGPFAAGGISEEERAYWEEAFADWTETESYEQYIEENYLTEELKTGEEFENYLENYEDTIERALEGAE